MNEFPNQNPTADDLLIETDNGAVKIFRKNIHGDFIQVGSVSRPEFVSELNDQNEPHLRFEVHIEVRYPINLNYTQSIAASSVFQYAEKLHDLMSEAQKDLT